MGGAIKKAWGFTPVGASVGYLGRQGDKAASDWQSQFDAYNMQRPEAEAYISPLDESNRLQKDLTLSGPEAYLKASEEKQLQEQQALQDSAAAKQASATAQAQSALAQRGGLRGGSAERLAMQGARGQQQALQDISMQGAQGRAALGLQGEQMRREAERYNLENTLKGMEGKNLYNANKYNQQMAAWGANRTAQAGLEQGKGKGQRGGVMGGVGKVLGK